MNTQKRVFAFLLTAALLLSLIPGSVFAALPQEVGDAVNASLSGYYAGERKGELKDWEEMAAVRAAGGNLLDYQLPQVTAETPAGNAILIALMKRDLASAKALAAALVQSGKLIHPGGANAFIGRINAMEAYNAAAAAAGYETVSFDRDAALNDLLQAQNPKDGGFYDYDGKTSSVDSTGLGLVGLSWFQGGEPADSAIARALEYLKTNQDSGGGWESWGAVNANTVATALYGLIAVGEDPYQWTAAAGLSPVDSLLSFQASGGGFYYGEFKNANAFASRQATLALADLLAGESFFHRLGTGYNAAAPQLKSLDLQVVDADGSYQSRYITAANDETLDGVLSRMGASGALSNFQVFSNGQPYPKTNINQIDDGMPLLFIHRDIDRVMWFRSAAEPMGIFQQKIGFGETVTLQLMEASIDAPDQPQAAAGHPVDTNGDAYYEALTDATGRATLSFYQAGTHEVRVLRESYGLPAIPTSTALLPARITMQTGDVQRKVVSLQVEGPTENLCYNSNVTVSNYGESVLTVLDALESGLLYEEIPYEKNGTYVTSIGGFGERYLSEGGGWVYILKENRYINGSAYPDAMDAQVIEDGDEIILYYSDWREPAFYPIISYSRNSDKSLKISVERWVLENGSPVLQPVSDVAIAWALDRPSAFNGFTNADGFVTIPAGKAKNGAYTLQLEKKNSSGLPALIRLAPRYEVTVTDSGASGSRPETSGDDNVYITVQGSRNTLFARKGFSWYRNMTPLSLLDQTGLSYEADSTGYVKEIEGEREFGQGANSGWMYKVNGVESIPESASRYQLNRGDELVWFYTKDYTREKGFSGGNATDKNSLVTVSITASAGKDGIAVATLSGNQLTSLTDALKNGKDQVNDAAVIRVSLPAGATGLEVTLPKTLIAAFSNLKNTALQISSDLGTLIPDAKALQTAGGSNNDALTFRLESVSGAALTGENLQRIGDRPVWQLSAMAGDRTVVTFGGGRVQVNLPYIARAGEEAAGLGIRHIGADGKGSDIADAQYIAGSRQMRFTTDHFSLFAVTYRTPSTIAFSDVPPTHWAYAFIQDLAGKGILQGRSTGIFAPSDPITRAEFAATLTRMSGENLPQAAPLFADVADNAWYASAVAWAKEAAIVEGVSDTHFSPAAPITREDMAVMIARYAAWRQISHSGMEAGMTAAAFADADAIAAYAAEAVSEMQQAGLISGKPGNLFAPKDSATRAEAAKILSLLPQKYQ